MARNCPLLPAGQQDHGGLHPLLGLAAGVGPAKLELLLASQSSPPAAGQPRSPLDPASTGCRLARNQHLEGISAADCCRERGGL